MWLCLKNEDLSLTVSVSVSGMKKDVLERPSIALLHGSSGCQTPFGQREGRAGDGGCGWCGVAGRREKEGLRLSCLGLGRRPPRAPPGRPPLDASVPSLQVKSAPTKALSSAGHGGIFPYSKTSRTKQKPASCPIGLADTAIDFFYYNQE